MRIIVFLSLFLLLLAGCQPQNAKQRNTKTVSAARTDSLPLPYRPGRTKPLPVKTPRIYAYTDSVPVHVAPSDTSAVLTFLNYLDSLDRFRLFADYEGRTSEFSSGMWWCAVWLNGDTAWVKIGSDISSTCDIDTIGHISLKSYYGGNDYGGFDYYLYTDVINIRDSTLVLRTYLDLKATRMLTRSLLLLVPYNDVMIYDLIKDSTVYHAIAESYALSGFEDRIYMTRDWEAHHKRIPVELWSYNFIRDTATLLYREPDDSTYISIQFEEGSHSEPLKKEIIKNVEYITMTIFRDKENPRDEMDVIKYEIRVDEKGKLVYRKQL